MFLALAFSAALGLTQQSATVKDVAWLAGCWEFTRGNRHVTEQWTDAAGGTMLGVSRTITDAKTTGYEFVLIREANGKLEYVAKPSGQAEATFSSVVVTPGEVTFENLQHDFPTRIRYRRQADGGLLATTEGTINGKPRAIEFPYRAVACHH